MRDKRVVAHLQFSEVNPAARLVQTMTRAAKPQPHSWNSPVAFEAQSSYTKLCLAYKQCALA
jgi:hypothetical protein